MRWLVMLIIISLLFPGVSQAEKPKEAWVMCSPRGEVCVRSKPKRQSEEVGRVFSGDHIQLSGKRSGNWYHCYVPCEDGQGWIRGDYLSFEEPEIYEGGKLFDESDPRYKDAWVGALDRLAGTAASHTGAYDKKSGQAFENASRNDNVIFEINTGAISRGYRTSPYPAKEILIEIARRGIPVILSSDSHEKSTLMYGFDEAEKLADELGLERVTL